MTKSKGTKDMELNPYSDWYGGGKKKPHTCPVCRGTGTVGAAFYSRGWGGSTEWQKCRSCGGTGILWEKQ